MKKIIILSSAAIVVLFISLAINSNVKNNSASVNLKSALQSASAAEVFVHDSPKFSIVGGDVGLTSQQKRWWNGATIFVGVSYSGNVGYETINQYRLACLIGGESACTNPGQTLTTSIPSYNVETGQTTLYTYTRNTRFWGIVTN